MHLFNPIQMKMDFLKQKIGLHRDYRVSEHTDSIFAVCNRFDCSGGFIVMLDIPHTCGPLSAVHPGGKPIKVSNQSGFKLP